MIGFKKSSRKEEKDLRVERVTIQVSAKEKELIGQLAKEQGLNISDYIRLVCIYKKYNDIFGGI